MGSESKKTTLSEKMRILVDKKIFENPKVSPEGYGSFISTKNSLDTMISHANSLKMKADELNNKDSIAILFKSLYLYLRSLVSISENDLKAYLNMIRVIIKLVEYMISHAKKHNVPDCIAALEWGLFNLKTVRLFKEADLIKNNKDTATYAYLINVLKDLNGLYDKNKINTIEVVAIEFLEVGIQIRLENSQQHKQNDM